MTSQSKFRTETGWGIVTVRGTVTQVEPAKPATGWFKWLKEDTPARFHVRIDAGAHQQLCAHLKERAQGRQVAQIICIGGNLIDQLLLEADRVWVSFSTSYEHESHFFGRPPLDFNSLEIINNEKDVHQHELIDDEPPLPLAAA
jgi:hypothetical protein